MVLLIGFYLPRIPYDDLLGIVSGPQGIRPCSSMPCAWRRLIGPTFSMQCFFSIGNHH
jgi:hypothetical protein